MQQSLPQTLVLSARGRDTFNEPQADAIEAVTRVTFAAQPERFHTPEQLVQLAAPYEVLAMTRRPYPDLDRSIIEALPNLRGLAVHTTADYWIDTAALAERNIQLLTLPGYATTSVAEHTMACLLTMSRRTHLSNDRARELIGDHVSLRGFELRGRRVGLIGHGRIGQAIEPMLASFGMKVAIHDPASPKTEPLDDVLGSADVVILAASHTRGRRPIIGKEELREMQARYLINASCDELVDHCAVADALRNRTLDGYAVDEYDEVLADPGIEPGRVLQTMHTGWYSDEAMARGVEQWSRNILDLAATCTGSEADR